MTVVEVSPDGRELAGLLASVPRPGILGICGAPGSGKTTFAASLGQPMVPMDGFHLADVELTRRGLLGHKGAPETFDPWGYAALLARLREHADRIVMAPMFERDLEQPIAGAIAIPDRSWWSPRATTSCSTPSHGRPCATSSTRSGISAATKKQGSRD